MAATTPGLGSSPEVPQDSGRSHWVSRPNPGHLTEPCPIHVRTAQYHHRHDIRQRNDDSTTPLTKRRRSRRGALRTSSPPTFGCCVCRVSNIYFQNKSIAHHTTLWLMFFNSRPSDRSGPGYFSTDRNVRSKCRCSNVSCSSHYDAQLTAFFIDPRAK
ncbi:unnamed protein product [Parnassius mnemosyne]|uniref:Uncharacterized protein n=1 Tax=Parnassius mnemosyne TaxID=213953 RepID=A0AAV1LUW2_9NEOP